jgi:uncharacterized membrane protein
MRLLAESLAAAFIALFILNFLGLSVSMLASVTSFFVVLLVIVLIEEKSGFSSRAILKKYRLDRPIIATAIVFGLLFVLAIVFSIINTRLSAIITPFINSLEGTLGLLGLVVISALAYRLFYHFMYQEIELDTGLELVKKVRTKIGGR